MAAGHRRAAAPTGGGGGGGSATADATPLTSLQTRAELQEIQASQAGGTGTTSIGTGGTPNGTNIVERSSSVGLPSPLASLPDGYTTLEFRTSDADHVSGYVRIQGVGPSNLTIDGSNTYWFFEMIGIPNGFPLMDSGGWMTLNSYFGPDYRGTSHFPFQMQNIGGQNQFVQMDPNVDIWRMPATPGWHKIARRAKLSTTSSGWIEVYYSKFGEPMTLQTLRTAGTSGGTLVNSNTRLNTVTIGSGHAQGLNNFRSSFYREWPQANFSGMVSIYKCKSRVFNDSVVGGDVLKVDPEF
jgi:hypothetical protein